MIRVQLNPNKEVMSVEGLWQYDYGRTLLISGLDLPELVNIEFSLHETMGEAIPRTGITTDGVTTVAIPNELLAKEEKHSNYYIYAFICIEDELKRYTYKRINLFVRSRTKPGDYDVPDGAPDYVIGQIDKLSKEIVGKITAPATAEVGQTIVVEEVDENGKPIKFKCVDAGGATSWNDLEDKPFGVTTELVEIVPEQSVAGISLEDELYLWAEDTLPFIDIEEGTEYIISINDVVYRTTSKPTTNVPGVDKGALVRIQNGSNEFVIENFSTGNGGHNLVYWSRNWGETISLKIIAKKEIVKPIDKAFIPKETEIVELYRNDFIESGGWYEHEGRRVVSYEEFEIDKKLRFKKGHKYKVILNDKEYSFIASVKQNDYNSLSLGDFWRRKDSFEIQIDEDDNPDYPYLMIVWDRNVYEDGISVAIYDEESEIVNNGAITLHSTNWDDDYLYKDKDGNEKITKAELLPLIENGCNIVVVRWESGMFRWSSNKVYAYVNIMDDSYVEMKVTLNTEDDAKLFHTAEYTTGPA